LHGPLKRTEIGDSLQGIDYVYTVNGQLKSINHPSLREILDPGKDGYNNGFNKDLFGMALDYYPNDYTRSGEDSIGEELITNGGFVTDSDWDKDNGTINWTISEGKAKISGISSNDYGMLEQTGLTLVKGRHYRLEFTTSNAV